jgi:hypothetical protein
MFEHDREMDGGGAGRERRQATQKVRPDGWRPGMDFLVRENRSTRTADVIMVGTGTLAVTRPASMNRAARPGSNAGTMTHPLAAGRLPAPGGARFIPRPLIAPGAHCVHDSSLAVITMTGCGEISLPAVCGWRVPAA